MFRRFSAVAFVLIFAAGAGAQEIMIMPDLRRDYEVPQIPDSLIIPEVMDGEGQSDAIVFPPSRREAFDAFTLPSDILELHREDVQATVSASFEERRDRLAESLSAPDLLRAQVALRYEPIQTYVFPGEGEPSGMPYQFDPRPVFSHEVLADPATANWAGARLSELVWSTTDTEDQLKAFVDVLAQGVELVTADAWRNSALQQAWGWQLHSYDPEMFPLDGEVGAMVAGRYEEFMDLYAPDIRGALEDIFILKRVGGDTTIPADMLLSARPEFFERYPVHTGTTGAFPAVAMLVDGCRIHKNETIGGYDIDIGDFRHKGYEPDGLKACPVGTFVGDAESRFAARHAKGPQARGGYCTAFLADGTDTPTRKQIITAEHCISDSTEACASPRAIGTIKVVFGFKSNIDGHVGERTFHVPDRQVFDIARVTYDGRADKGVDLMVLELNEEVGAEIASPLSIDRGNFYRYYDTDENLFLAGHPAGLSMQVDQGEPKVIGTDGTFVRVTTDSYGGYSGAPLISRKTGNVFAMIVEGRGDSFTSAGAPPQCFLENVVASAGTEEMALELAKVFAP